VNSLANHAASAQRKSLPARLHVLTGMFFCIFMGAGAQQAYLVAYLQRMNHWSALECSIVIASVYLGMMLFRLLNIYLFGRWSDRRFAVMGALAYLYFPLAMAASPFVNSYPFAVASGLLWGAGAAMMWTGTTMLTLVIADEAGGRHGAGMGLLYASSHAGWLAGAIVLGLLYDYLHQGALYWLYVLAAAITLGGNVLSLLLPASPPQRRDRPNLANLAALIANPRILIPGVLQWTSALSFGLLLGALSPYVERRYGPEWIWVVSGSYLMVRMVLSFLSGYLADRLGQTAVLVVGFAAGGVGLRLAVTWPSLATIVPAAAMLGLLSGSVPVVASAMVGTGARRRRRAVVHAVIFSWRDLGVFAAAVGANIVGLEYGLDTAFSAFSYAFFGCAGLSILLMRFAGRGM
jgi:MFS family permease